MVDRAGKHRGVHGGTSPCPDHRRSIARSSRASSLRRPGNWFGSAACLMPLSSGLNWFCFWPKSPPSRIPRPDGDWGFTRTRSAVGGIDGPPRDLFSRTVLGRGVRPSFPPQEIVAIKAIACELPAIYDRPLSRLFIPDIIEIAVEEGVVDQISPATVWRLLDTDALKPWRRRSWIWPRDPLFYERAAPALDLYAGYWHGKPLGEGDFVLSADEKTSIQARRRLHRRCVARDGRGQRVEHEYDRMGAWAYMAAWDVHRACVFGRVEEKTGIEPFGRLIDQVMRREPYRSARRVFWIVDGGSSHHRSTFPQRLQAQYRNAVAVVLPVHASWINQIEIYFSILERRVLTPNDFADLPEVRDHIMRFGKEFSRHAEPFDWTFTRKDLRELVTKLRRPKAALRMVVKGRAA